MKKKNDTPQTKLGKKKQWGMHFYRVDKFFFCSEKKCQDYIKHHLRAPTRAQVVLWARQLKFPAADIDRFNESILLRHELGKKTNGLALTSRFFYFPSPLFFRPGCWQFV